MIMRNTIHLYLVLVASVSFAGTGWWPEQKTAKAYLTAEWPSGLEEQVILQAVTGLKARAVNEGAGDELVWIQNS
jgi:hypothetical protein